MSEAEEPVDPRAAIALRNRQRALNDRARKYTHMVFGLMAYSAFSNLVAGALSFSSSPPDAWLGIVLSALYSLGAYRVWMKDDTSWWPVAVPAGISIVILLLAWIGELHRPIPLVLNFALLVLVPIRKRATLALAGRA